MSKGFFVVAQKAVIKDRGRYLVVKRSEHGHLYPNRWEFPGGKLEKGEDILKSLEREVLEETSLRVKAIRPVFAFHHAEKSKQAVFIFHLCERLSGKVKLSHEHTKFRWAKMEEIQKLEITPALKAFLGKAL